MIRILLVDGSARGGIAAYTTQLVEALVRAGQSPALLTSSGSDHAAVSATPSLRWLPDPAWRRPAGAWAQVPFYASRARDLAVVACALRAALRQVQPDVIHLQTGLHQRLDGHLLRWAGRRAPVVLTMHDTSPLDGTSGQLAAARAADLVLVHTEPARLVLVEHGINAQVIEHLPPAVPQGADVPVRDARSALGLPQDERVLAALGFVRSYKGYELLATVWEELGERAPLLLVQGEAWDAEQEALLDRLRASGRADVRKGYATDLELALGVRAADALLLPYVAASDSGLLHLARRLGTPVLASDAPQLSASVLRTRSGTVLPRTVQAWTAAVMGRLPPPPPAPAPLIETGRRHLQLYESVTRTP